MTPAARKFFAWLPAVVVAVVVWASLTGRLPGWLFSGSERVQEAELNLYGMLVDSQGRISDEAEALRLIERGNVDPNEPMIGTMAGPAYRFLHLTTSPDNAKRAIELGADVNQRAGRDGPTPLFTAKTAELVKALLDNGADPDITSNGRKAIHINPSLPAIEAMIQHGVDVDSPAANGDTALSVLFQTASFPGSLNSIATWNNMPWRQSGRTFCSRTERMSTQPTKAVGLSLTLRCRSMRNPDRCLMAIPCTNSSRLKIGRPTTPHSGPCSNLSATPRPGSTRKSPRRSSTATPNLNSRHSLAKRCARTATEKPPPLKSKPPLWLSWT